VNPRDLLARVFPPGLAAIVIGSAAAPNAGQAPEAAPAARRSIEFGSGTVLLAGESRMGARRLYPSPVFHDMNGDGRLDLAIGDLWGKITVALRLPGEGPALFGPEEPLLARDGAPLDFKNW
jgi:hypothetical protein